MVKLTALLISAILFSGLAYAELPSGYQALSAEQKQTVLWRNIAVKPYPSLPEMKGKTDLTFLKSMMHLEKSFNPNTDEMITDRVKVIHKYGSAVRVELRPDPQSPFSGLFKSGAIGIARLSLALPYEPGGTFVPGLAIKLLVDGQASKNIFVMQKLEGQGTDTNYFKNIFTNILPNPTETKTEVGKWYFERFVTDAIHLNVDHVASVTNKGESVAEPHAPFQLLFAPALGLALPSAASDFRTELAKIPPGTVLYDIFGLESDARGGYVYKVGQLVATSEFISSAYEDETLYFEHAGTTLRSGWVRWIW